ncbi:MAG: TonB-dependent receptor [Bacteroidetes bacterium]|nr:TonB-dependent receptor [Bacteroidota bacterium]
MFNQIKRILFPIIPLFFVAFFAQNTFSQNATIQGIIVGENNTPLESVNIAVKGTTSGATSNKDGFYSLLLNSGTNITLVFSSVGYYTFEKNIILEENEVKILDIELMPSATVLPEVEITEKQIMSSDLVRLDPKHTQFIPGPSSGVENIIKTMPGVSVSSELSSQYSVRGGNFDENLVYVNGIEIYRPFLVRSGQQEGLSFINSELVSSITFSAGGFNSEYGDKMSSVLDIQYKQPKEFAGSASVSLLEGSVHLEGDIANNKAYYLFGFRHKSNQYLLGTFDTKGDYKPSFTDVQALLNWNFKEDWDITFLGNYSRNNYQFIPEVQKTRFGYITDVRELTVYFDGQEVDRFTTSLGALSLQYKPHQDLKLQFISSLFQSDEKETFDILGQYWIQEIQTDFGQDDFGQPTGRSLGVGTFHNHARNYLNAIVWNAEHKGIYIHDNNIIKWGVKYQYEDIYDRLNEWTMLDSAGYSLPQIPQNNIILHESINSNINLISSRFSGFLQTTSEFERDHGRFLFTAGLRGNYWNYSNQFVLSPRMTVLYKPLWAPKFTFRASGGHFSQPAFYRELRDFEGNLNPNIKAQESWHIVLGSEYIFLAWDRPFKYTTEVYYKILKNLIPYEIDNVRIRYHAENSGKGYAAGLDMRINGEFVPGIESWASFSFMKTEEIISGYNYIDSLGNFVNLGYIPRPTDQRLSFNLFFQDFLPRNPNYKVHLGLIYATGLPFGPPNSVQYKNALRMPSYRRVDIGFSRQLIGPESKFKESNPLRYLKSSWISLEVFNLFGINNTISYMWVKDFDNRYMAIPNYLTTRLINLKLLTYF